MRRIIAGVKPVSSANLSSCNGRKYQQLISYHSRDDKPLDLEFVVEKLLQLD